ncbi:MAG TPA: helix-turn-helix domain-containing protein [Candidatus Binataceae bacterium]|nr:helix-turn-helix domain-containing protein [Candidatus Binataceae bacterium]
MRKSLFDTLVELLGREPAEKLVAEFGGARIWVPVHSAPEAQLAQLLGTEKAAALCDFFGGDYMQVPNTIARQNVYGRIVELHREGRKINEIALAVGRSRRTVFRLLGRKITDVHRSPSADLQRTLRGLNPRPAATAVRRPQ